MSPLVSKSVGRSPFTQHGSDVTMTVRVTPRAGRTTVAGVRDDVLLVKLAAAPVDGAANDALVGLLAGAFDVPKRAIQIAQRRQEPHQARRHHERLRRRAREEARDDPGRLAGAAAASNRIA